MKLQMTDAHTPVKIEPRTTEWRNHLWQPWLWQYRSGH